ncbi:hypothetical protein [Nocardia sp. alder85J]|nr:hypothetical protein [Nocardia sp. alder85J]MCX4097748.1 hypothetical protein [Nocardia sp. alder85J]
MTDHRVSKNPEDVSARPDTLLTPGHPLPIDQYPPSRFRWRRA